MVSTSFRNSLIRLLTSFCAIVLFCLLPHDGFIFGLTCIIVTKWLHWFHTSHLLEGKRGLLYLSHPTKFCFTLIAPNLGHMPTSEPIIMAKRTHLTCGWVPFSETTMCNSRTFLLSFLPTLRRYH